MPSGSPSHRGSPLFRTRKADPREVYKELEIARDIYHIYQLMLSLSLLLLVAQSSALQYSIPSTFGGKTAFSDRGWKMVIDQLSSQMELGKAPSAQIEIATEPTCIYRYMMCTTSYFGKNLEMTQPETAQLWVKWHQDASPFACDSADGCSVSSTYSVADLSSQTKGWSVTASINAKAGTNNDKPIVNGDAGINLSFQYSDSRTVAQTITSTKTLSAKCSQNNICYLQTGTLMMTVTGSCDSKPVIVCDRDYFPCAEFNDPDTNICSQWADFTRKYCKPGVYTPSHEECSVTVAVTGEHGEPISFQVLEQMPIEHKRSTELPDDDSAESSDSTLPDGSSGVWMAWSP